MKKILICFNLLFLDKLSFRRSTTHSVAGISHHRFQGTGKSKRGMIIVLVGYGLLLCESNSTWKFSRGCSYTYRSKSGHTRIISRVTSLVQCFLFLENILATLLFSRLVYCMTQNPSQSIFFLCLLQLNIPHCRAISGRSGHTRSFFFME